jgi:chromosome segregation ATPase
MQPSDNSQLNLGYAQEWITFLKRRNLILTIIWPIFLVLSILASLTAFYFFQLEQTTQLNLSIETEKNLSLKESQQKLFSEVDTLKSSNEALNTELDALKNAREELSVLNTNSASKLNITSQMIDNLNQLVSELKNEREDLITQLNNSQASIELLKIQHQELIDQAHKEKITTVTELNKQIDSRKSAYQALANRQQEMREEIERLNNSNNSKDKQIQNLNNDNKSLNVRLNEKNKEIKVYQDKLSLLEKNYSNLELKLNSLVSPIGSSSSNDSSSKAQTAPQTDASRKITGLEEIKRPVKQNQNTSQSNNQDFDHNQITILP